MSIRETTNRGRIKEPEITKSSLTRHAPTEQHRIEREHIKIPNEVHWYNIRCNEAVNKL